MQTGEFRCPEEGGGLYAFWVTCCTFDMKKALLAIRKNGKDVANVFDQDGDQNKASFEGNKCDFSHKLIVLLFLKGVVGKKLI